MVDAVVPQPLPHTASPWPALATAFLGGIDPTATAAASVNDLLIGTRELDRGHAYLTWCDYRSVADLAARLVDHRKGANGFADGFADLAKRLSRTRGITQRAAERLIDDAVALFERLPRVADTLRDGVITPEWVRVILSRTDLVDGRSAQAVIDTEIAATLRRRHSGWSRQLVRDMADRVVFRHDPDGVRKRRQRALDDRGVWTHNRDDGTGEIGATMAAEHITVAAASVRALADHVCPRDSRTLPQRLSDAMFTLLTGAAFGCDCGDDACDAPSPDVGRGRTPATTVVIHVIADEATVGGGCAGDTPGPSTPPGPDSDVRPEGDTGPDSGPAGPADPPPGHEPSGGDSGNPGYLVGHGVISPEHVRDLAARPEAQQRRIVPRGTAPETVELPAGQPSNPYRPSTALDEFVRLRDGTCVDPACPRSAFDADLDHVAEYDHVNPDQGGATVADGLNSKCRFDHNHKTFTDWVDDQYRDDDGRLVVEFITPEGLILPGPAETLEDLFPGLRRYRFRDPPRPPRSPVVDPPPGLTTRVAAKHARRRAERRRNRKRRTNKPIRREASFDDPTPPPF